MAKKPKWTWKPCAVGGKPDKYAEDVTVEAVGSNQDGEVLYTVETPTGMTLAEMKAFALWLIGDFAKKAE